MWEVSLTIITDPEKKSDPKKFITPVEWIWNPEKNTYGRVIFVLGVPMIYNYLFFGRTSWVSSSLFLGTRIAVSLAGRGWHLVYLGMNVGALIFRYISCGTTCLLTDLALGYFLNYLYFSFASELKKPDNV